MGELQFGGKIVWRPSPEGIARSHLKQFMDRRRIETLADLQDRSTEDPEWFWTEILKDLGIIFDEPYSRVLDLSRGAPWARWCVGAKMNIVRSAVERWVTTQARDRAAIRWEGEDGSTRTLTYADLQREVERLASGLRSLGLGKGDVVGLFLPMCPEVAIALLATVKIGGIALPLFSGYGAGAVAARLTDAGAVALITADGVPRRGQVIRMKPVADDAIAQVNASGAAGIRQTIIVRRAGVDVPMRRGRDHEWDAVVTQDGDGSTTEVMSAEDPLMIIYTSGTTGRPKGAVHTHCGFPIKAAQDMAHGLDLHEWDVLYWMTDMGWMMGPWEVFGSLLLGGTMLLYDGAPDYPGPDRLWSLVSRHQVSLLGVSPTAIRALAKFGPEPVMRHNLRSLRAFASTGEPWDSTSWLWLFQTVGRGELPIINYSGGTEISGGIVMGNWLTPCKPCAFAGPLPGMAADVVDEAGSPIRGRVGELVVRKPWIGMTRGFWNDPERYLATYWSRIPNVWFHGDWAAVDEDGLWYILGRSDDVIKVAGKRLGPAEVESILARNPAVQEAAAIGVPDELKGEAVVCFCVLRSTATGSDALRDELKDQVGVDLGKALVPKDVLFVRDLPRTRNAKIMRRMIRAAYLGADPGDTSSLENPAALDDIRRAAINS